MRCLPLGAEDGRAGLETRRIFFLGTLGKTVQPMFEQNREKKACHCHQKITTLLTLGFAVQYLQQQC